jgi:hypothetical protein
LRAGLAVVPLPGNHWRDDYPNLAKLYDKLSERQSFKDTVPPKPMPKPTPPEADSRRLQMADIARLAGVSTSTVSRAGRQQADQRRDAHPRHGAGALAQVQHQHRRAKPAHEAEPHRGRGVPYDPATRQHLSDPFFLSMLGSLADALTEQGFDMLVSRVDASELDAAARRSIPAA